MFAVYGLSDWQLWVAAGWFVPAVTVSWFFPGLIVLHWTKLSKLHQFYLAPVIGLVMWTLVAYSGGWLDLPWLTFIYLLGSLGGTYYYRRSIFPLHYHLQLDRVTQLLMGVGIITQLIPVIGSGLRIKSGIVYYFVNIFDGIFHLSLARATIASVPPWQPGAIGLPVTNYHYLSNLAIGELTRIWHLPLNHLYFQFLPILVSLWLGLLIIVILKQWSTRSSTTWIGLFLFYLSGELSWIVNIILGSHSITPVEVYVDHGMVQLLNPPQAFAKLVWLATLPIWHFFLTTKKTTQRWLVVPILASMIGILFGLKIYFGILAALQLIVLTAIEVISTSWSIVRVKTVHRLSILRRLIPWIMLDLSAGGIAALVFLPANQASGGLFFDLLTWPKLLLGVSKLNWNEWWLRLQVYQAASNTKALIIWYGLALGIFLVSIFHLKLLGILAVYRPFRQQAPLKLIWSLVLPSVILTYLGLNYLQASGGYNTFNFFIVAITPLILLSALTLGYFTKYRWGIGVTVAILLLTLGQTIGLYHHFVGNYLVGRDRQVITPLHEEVLTYLKTDQRIIQTLPGHFLDETTPYLFFFTGQPSWVGGRGILNSHNQPVSERLDLLSDLAAADASTSAQLAIESGITDLMIAKQTVADHLFFDQALGQATNSAQPHWQLAVDNQEYAILQPTVPQ